MQLCFGLVTVAGKPLKVALKIAFKFIAVVWSGHYEIIDDCSQWSLRFQPCSAPRMCESAVWQGCVAARIKGAENSCAEEEHCRVEGSGVTPAQTRTLEGILTATKLIYLGGVDVAYQLLLIKAFCVRETTWTSSDI